MKRTALLIFALVCLILLAAAAPLTGRHPFRGLWRGIDAFDESRITLRITEESRSEGHVYEINGGDDRTGSWCGGAAEMKAIGVLEGENIMGVSIVWWCLADPTSDFHFLGDTYTFDPIADTITSSDGSVFYRGR